MYHHQADVTGVVEAPLNHQQWFHHHQYHTQIQVSQIPGLGYYVQNNNNYQMWPPSAQSLQEIIYGNINPHQNQQEQDAMISPSSSSGSSTSTHTPKLPNLKPKRTITRERYRVPYSQSQLTELEKEFVSQNHYISFKHREELALKLGLTPRQVKVWFQNRRAKDRRITKMQQSEEQIITASFEYNLID